LGMLGAINIVFLAIYLSGEYDTGAGAQPTVSGFLYSTGYSLFRNTIPAYVGGPFHWGGEGIYGFACTPLVIAWLAGVLVLIILALAVRGDRAQSARLVGAAMAYLVPIYLIIYVGRVAQVSDLTSVNDLRLH